MILQHHEDTGGRAGMSEEHRADWDLKVAQVRLYVAQRKAAGLSQQGDCILSKHGLERSFFVGTGRGTFEICDILASYRVVDAKVRAEVLRGRAKVYEAHGETAKAEANAGVAPQLETCP